MKPLHFFDEIIDVKNFVCHYLDYVLQLDHCESVELTIYAEMRNLALEKYGINMLERTCQVTRTIPRCWMCWKSCETSTLSLASITTT